MNINRNFKTILIISQRHSKFDDVTVRLFSALFNGNNKRTYSAKIHYCLKLGGARARVCV